MSLQVQPPRKKLKLLIPNHKHDRQIHAITAGFLNLSTLDNLGLDNYLSWRKGDVLCIVGCLAASIVPIHYKSVGNLFPPHTPTHNVTIKISPNISQWPLEEANHFHLRKNCLHQENHEIYLFKYISLFFLPVFIY